MNFSLFEEKTFFSYDKPPGATVIKSQEESNKLELKQEAQKRIDEIRRHGEAGIQHLGYISDDLERPIIIYDENGRIKQIFGENKPGKPLEAQYFQPNNDNPQGHWTLKGGKEPVKYVDTGSNNCLFNVLAEQTGHDPNELRSRLVESMELSIDAFANQLSEIKMLELCRPNELCLGGGRLVGRKEIELDTTDVEQIVNVVNDPIYRRREAFQEQNLEKFVDEQGGEIQVDKHHLIPEDYIRQELKEFINKHKSEPKYLKQEFEYFLNHGSNQFGKALVIRNAGLENGENDVSSQFLAAVSWHTNNLRIGPTGTLRENDPGSSFDTELMDENTKRIINNYTNSNDRNILRLLNTLPNDQANFGWRLNHRYYVVDKNVQMKFTMYYYQSYDGKIKDNKPFFITNGMKKN